MQYSAYRSGQLFTKAHTVVRGQIVQVLSLYGLNLSDWFILEETTRSQEGVRLARVASSLNVKAPLVTMQANELIKQGLIQRVAHHTDGRAKLLVPTSKGRKVAADARHAVELKIADLMKGISRKDAETFQQCLEIINQNAKWQRDK